MSTPTGRPFNPVNISDYAPKRVRERGGTQGQSTSGEAADRSAEAPKKPRQQPTEAHPADGDHHETPLAPTGPHELPASEPEEDGEENPPLPFGPKKVARQDEAAEADTKGDYDDDLWRLESSLQQLRRERTALTGEEIQPRLPRASQLPPVAGLRPPDDFGRDTYIDGFRLPRSLGPTFVPPPPLREKRTNHLGLALRVAVACAIAAPIAYYFSVGGGVAPTKSDKGPMLSSAGTRAVDLPPGRAAPPPQVTQKQVEQVPVARPPVAEVQAPEPVAPSNEVRTAMASPSQSETVGMLPTSANPAPPAPVSKPVRTIDAEAVRLLLTQGEQFINTGDLVTARLLFRRAAEAGDADGALALGATYDPGVLAKLGVRGIAPDIEQARNWYEKARDLGSSDAPRRLKILANR
jgi:hypothetical protein